MAILPSQHPPTPPDNDDHDLQDGFNQLLQHNARAQHPSDQYNMSHTPYVQSSNTSYTTPEPDLGGQWYVDQYGNQSWMLPDQLTRVADPQYVSAIWAGLQKMTHKVKDGYGQPIYHGHQNAIYQGHPLPQQQLVRLNP